MQEPNQAVVPPAAQAPAKPASVVDFQTQQLQYLKQIADNTNFIKSVIIIGIVLSLLGAAAQFCAGLGLLK